MSASDEFIIFCRNYGIEPEKPRAWECYRREAKGLPWERDDDVTECPNCGKRSFKAATAYCFYGCGKVEGFDVVELTPEQRQAEKQLRAEQAAENTARALRIWDQCGPISGSNATVATYFRARCLSLDVLPDLDAVMRWHPRCPYGGGGNREPCVVSLFRDCITDEPTAIHRTHIISASHGKKDEPKAYGPIAGAAIKLWPLAKGGETLTVGEGIETVLSAVELGFGSPPAWAVTVANNLSSFPVIRGVKQLTIASDHDEKKGPDHKTGQEHAEILRWKWLDRGREAVLTMPEEVGWDFNDVLKDVVGGQS